MKKLSWIFLSVLFTSCATPVVYKKIYIPRKENIKVSKNSEVNYIVKHTNAGSLRAANEYEGNNMSYNEIPSEFLNKNIKFLSNKAITVTQNADSEVFAVRFEEGRTIHCLVAKDYTLDMTENSFRKNFSKLSAQKEIFTYDDKIENYKYIQEFKEISGVVRLGRNRTLFQTKAYLMSLKVPRGKYKRAVCIFDGLGMKRTLKRIMEEFAEQVFPS